MINSLKSLAAEPAFEAEIYTRFPLFSHEALENIGRSGCRILLAAGADSVFMGGAGGYYTGIGKLLGCDTVLLEGCTHFAPMERCELVAKMIAEVVMTADGNSRTKLGSGACDDVCGLIGTECRAGPGLSCL